jgi:hypothetical protein
VSWDALIRPWPIGATTVRFDGPTFEPDPNGVRALTFTVIDRRRVIDIAAWQPRSGMLASWRGQAFCLGDLDDIFNPATYFAGGALRIHRTPLEWLKAGREGVVILRPELCNAYLAYRQRLLVPDEQFANKVWRWLQPLKPTAEVLIDKPVEVAT